MENQKFIAEVEERLSKEFGEPIKISGFVEIEGKIQIKFAFVNQDTNYLPFNASLEDLHNLFTPV